eukprot:CAMPEP_0118660030 /NCGR_PEP_ID=MMETSP0785-20121206/15437_1 /TAXON_ID=91992 /ORGANISM="Bolidomonas pacifica, Strain CCMP 1866" /LENGTH=167 /DNA_ID=CAMNT_0006553193 /DNA_START=205 /DNA_END=708 /DNA_ORIENTATION=+
MTPRRRSIFGFPLEMLVMEPPSLPDLVTVSPDSKPFGAWNRIRRPSESCTETCSEYEDEEIKPCSLESLRYSPPPPILKPCFHTSKGEASMELNSREVNSGDANPRKRTWFDLRPPKVRVVTGDSGWWQPNDLKEFRDRMLQDECLPDLFKRNRVNSVDATFDYDYE